MAGKQFLKKHENCILSLAMALILAGILAAHFDFYYDLNDDVLIKDILSGVYSGTPDGHTMQLLYPLGALLALLYRGLSIPVFGAFLLFCQFGSIWAVGYRSTVLVDEERTAREGASIAPGMCSAASAARLAEPAVCSAWNTTAERLGVKGVLLLVEALFWFAAMGSHLVYLQYTVTAGDAGGRGDFLGCYGERQRTLLGAFALLAFFLPASGDGAFVPAACRSWRSLHLGQGKTDFFQRKPAALSWTVCSVGNRDGCFLRA